MRTTVDLPDELMRRAKSAAALRGIKLKEFIEDALARSLEVEFDHSALGQKRPIPVILSIESLKLTNMTNSEIEDMLVAEDVSRIGRN